MIQKHRNLVEILFGLVIVSHASANILSGEPICPLGFQVSYTKENLPICYRLKSPEPFNEKFEDCSGNLFNLNLYTKLDIPKINRPIWADFKTGFPGGQFIDWSYTDQMGDPASVLKNSDVEVNSNIDIEEELCIVFKPEAKLKAVRCDSKQNRYCFVKPYSDSDLTDDTSCGSLEKYRRFSSPRATCLVAHEAKGGGRVRANWSISRKLCNDSGGSIIHRGWRYANYPMFYVDSTNWTIPLGVVVTDETLHWVETEDGDDKVPDSEWGMLRDDYTRDNVVAIQNGQWGFKEKNYTFYDVICERSIHLTEVRMNLSFVDDNMILTVNDTVEENEIKCFTDAKLYPQLVKSKILDKKDDLNITKFEVKLDKDGYYWCVNNDSRNFLVSESNKLLYVEKRDKLINTYAIKIKSITKYNATLEDIKRWKMELNEYLYLGSIYLKRNGAFAVDDLNRTQEILKDFNKTFEKFEIKEVVKHTELKRLYLDEKTALLHVRLDDHMKTLPPSTWTTINVLSMKPVYYCKGFNNIPDVPLGESVIVAEKCTSMRCVGDFNEGVQWISIATDDCSTPKFVQVADSINVEVMPTVGYDPKHTTTNGHSENPQWDTSDSDSEEETTPCDEVTAPELILTSAKALDVPPNITHSPNTTTMKNTTVVTSYSTKSSTTDDSFEDMSLTTEVDTSFTNLNTNNTNPPPRPTPPYPRTDSTEVEPTTTENPCFTLRPVEEQIQDVIENINQMLQNGSHPSILEVAGAFDQVDSLLQTEDMHTIPGELLQAIDELGTKCYLNGTGTEMVVLDNIALVVADAGPSLPIRGLKIAAHENFTDDTFQTFTGEINSTNLAADENEAVVHLPPSAIITDRRISFVVFRNDRPFTIDTQHSVNSRVVSIKVENLTTFENGEVIDIHLRPIEQPERNQTRSCGYWEFNDDGSGQWSQDGCQFIEATEEGMMDTCRCDHLTHFAEILVSKTVFSEANENALEIISIVGCCISIFSLLLVGLTAAMFRSWRRDFTNKVWLQLCVSILFLDVCFLVVALAKFQAYDVVCMLTGVLLHYSVLVSFCWMLVAAILSYRRLVLVFSRDASHKLLKASAFAWGTPCAVIGILLAVSPHSYEGAFEDKMPSGNFCYPSGLALWLTVFAPILFMLVANWILFILIVRSVFASKRIQRHGDSNEALRCASVSCLLVFLFGLPWIFGLFASNVAMAYFFTLLTTLQGFVLFFFFVVGNKKTRDLWLNKLKIKQTRKIPVTSSTYTNKSSGGGGGGGGGGVVWKPAVGGPTAMEVNSSKPRSLANSDDSRFS